MAKLIRNGEVLSELEMANTAATRAKGLMGRKTFEDAIYLHPTNSVHTLFMRFTLDVAFLDKNLQVVAISSMKPWRMGWPRRKARSVIEATEGTFNKWNLQVGDALEISQ
jgi:uncharacterized protein